MLSGYELNDLFVALSRHGFTLTVEQQAEVFDLCVREASRLTSSTRVQEARLALAPIVCKRRQDQIRFYEVYDAWSAVVQTSTATPPPQLPSSETNAVPERRPPPNATLWILGCLAVCFTLALILSFLGDREREHRGFMPRYGAQSDFVLRPAPQPEAISVLERDEGLGSLRLLGLFVPFVIFAFWLHWRTTRRRAIAQQFQPDSDQKVDWLHAGRGDLRWIHSPAHLRRLSAFHVWDERGSARVDVEASIDATAKEGGRVVLVSRAATTPREYVALIQTNGPNDHAARLARSSVQLLEDNGVPIHVYIFTHDPQVVFPEHGVFEGLDLDEVLKRHFDAPVLMFGATDLFFQAPKRQLMPWVITLTASARCALLSYTDARQWGGLERELELQNVAVLPNSLDGLLAVPHELDVQLRSAMPTTPVRTERGHTQTNSGGLDEMFVAYELSNQIDSPTSLSSDISEIDGYLRERFDSETLYWMAACATYPEISWELTIVLGNALVDSHGERLLNEPRLQTLASLRWFRVAAIPNPIRIALIETMSSTQKDMTRAVVYELLADALTGTKRAAMPIATATPSETRNLVDDYVTTRDLDSAVRDKTFTSFLFGSTANRLAVQMSEELSRVLGFRIDLIPMVGIVIALLGMSGIHILVMAIEAYLPSFSLLVAKHQVVVLTVIYVSFIMSWCAFWTSVMMNSKFVVQLEEFRRPAG